MKVKLLIIQLNRKLLNHLKLDIRNWKFQSGFTVTEIAVTLGIMAILFGIILVNLVTIQQKTTMGTTISQISADLHQQQLRAMLGDTSGSSADSYGVHFGSTGYTLFKGSTYQSNNSSNVVIPLDNSLQFTTPNVDVVFAQLSGEISQSVTETVKDTTNSSTSTLQINTLGVLSQVN